MNKRQTRRTERKAEVLLHARQLISKGYDKLTMAALAHSMNASVGGLYRYYPSKEAIIVALQIDALNQLKGLLIRTIKNHFEVSGGDLSLIDMLFDCWNDFSRLEPFSAELLTRLSQTENPILSGEQRSQIGSEILEIIQVLEAALIRLSDIGRLSPGDQRVRALQLWGLIFGFEQLRLRQARNLDELPLQSIRSAYLKDIKAAWSESI